MHPLHAELASIERSLLDVVGRLAELARAEATTPQGERLSGELFGVEGQLRTGTRRLAILLRKL